jgi:hypothetical protein
LIKDSLAPSISHGFYSWIDRRGPSNMISEPGGLEFEPRPHTNSAARNSHLQKSIRWVAQTSGPPEGSSGTLAGTQ